MKSKPLPGPSAGASPFSPPPESLHGPTLLCLWAPAALASSRSATQHPLPHPHSALHVYSLSLGYPHIMICFPHPIHFLYGPSPNTCLHVNGFYHDGFACQLIFGWCTGPPAPSGQESCWISSQVCACPLHGAWGRGLSKAWSGHEGGRGPMLSVGGSPPSSWVRGFWAVVSSSGGSFWQLTVFKTGHSICPDTWRRA